MLHWSSVFSTIFPFLYSTWVRKESLVLPSLKGRRIKIHFLVEGITKELWTYVKSITVINKYLGDRVWGYANTLFLNISHPLILAFSCRICLQQLLPWCANGDLFILLVPSTFISWNSLVKMMCPFSFMYVFIQSLIYIGLDSYKYLLFGSWCNTL